jgi:hypothetical protein
MREAQRPLLSKTVTNKACTSRGIATLVRNEPNPAQPASAFLSTDTPMRCAKVALQLFSRQSVRTSVRRTR